MKAENIDSSSALAVKLTCPLSVVKLGRMVLQPRHAEKPAVSVGCSWMT